MPLTHVNETRGGTPEQVGGKRVRYYWTIRFAAWDTESYYAKVIVGAGSSGPTGLLN